MDGRGRAWFRAAGFGRGQVQGPVVDLWLALAAIVVTVMVCSAIRFTPLTQTQGLSWFGVTGETLVPFVAGMVMVAGLQWRAAARLCPSAGLDRTRWFLRLSAVLVVGIVATPYAIDEWFNAAHETVAAGLFVLQLAFLVGFWVHDRSALLGLLIAVQFGAGLMALAALLNLQSDLFYPQVAYQLAVGVHLPIAVHRSIR